MALDIGEKSLCFGRPTQEFQDDAFVVNHGLDFILRLSNVFNHPLEQCEELDLCDAQLRFLCDNAMEILEDRREVRHLVRDVEHFLGRISDRVHKDVERICDCRSRRRNPSDAGDDGKGVHAGPQGLCRDAAAVADDVWMGMTSPEVQGFAICTPRFRVARYSSSHPRAGYASCITEPCVPFERPRGVRRQKRNCLGLPS